MALPRDGGRDSGDGAQDLQGAPHSPGIWKAAAREHDAPSRSEVRPEDPSGEVDELAQEHDAPSRSEVEDQEGKGRDSTQALMPPIPIESLPATPFVAGHGSSKT